MRKLFIGLGQMGGRIAHRIQNDPSTNLHVYDINTNRCLQFQNFLEDLSDLNFDTVFTMLPDDEANEILFLRGDFLKNLKKCSRILDLSTISPNLSCQIRKTANDHGITYVDAPVSGGIIGADKGTLTLLIGAEKQELHGLENILSLISSNQIYLIKRGLGIVSKVCNNFLLLSSMVSTCESLTLAKKMGISESKMIEVFNSCSGKNWVTMNYSPFPSCQSASTPANNNYDGGFKCSLAIKDLRLAEMLFESSGLKGRTLNPILEIYSELVTEGFGSKDFSVYFKKFSEAENTGLE